MRYKSGKKIEIADLFSGVAQRLNTPVPDFETGAIPWELSSTRPTTIGGLSRDLN